MFKIDLNLLKIWCK